MSKADLIAQIAKEAGLTSKLSTDVTNILFKKITEALTRNEKVVITGFGTFLNRKRAARKGRNPQTGAEIQIPATVTPGFSPGKALKRAVKGQ